MNIERVTVGRDDAGRPECIEIDGHAVLWLARTVEQDGPVLGCIVYALNRLKQSQVDNLARLANVPVGEQP